MRLSLVCEQYSLEDAQLQEIPEFELESRTIRKETASKKLRNAKSLYVE
jgi:hypothetical protein